jgi:hypothetical protein
MTTTRNATENLKELFVDMIDLDNEIARVVALGLKYRNDGHTATHRIAAERVITLLIERTERS